VIELRAMAAVAIIGLIEIPILRKRPAANGIKSTLYPKAHAKF
jgi:hypothetical protein